MFNTARKDFTKKVAPYLAAGIHENLTLTEMELKVSSNGSQFIVFTYKNEAGLILTHREFDSKRQPGESDFDFEAKKTRQVNKIFNNQVIPYFGYIDGELLNDNDIMDRLPSQPKDGGTIGDMFEWLKTVIMPIAPTVKLRVKIVYDDMGYTQLPRQSTYTSVEPMSAKETEISIIDTIDNMTKPKVDREAHHIDPFANSNDQTPSGMPMGF